MTDIRKKPKPRHVCHAMGCEVKTPPSLFMCKPHWFMLPKRLQNAIWNTYVPGQERTKTPSVEYLTAAKEAIAWLAKAEGLL